MINKMLAYLRSSRQLGVIASLVFASLVCALLLGARIAYAWNGDYVGLAWNLFLAWLPLLIALLAYRFHRRSSRSSWALVGVCAFLWLLFLPNAPYLLTDIIRLRPRGNVPIWYDLILVIGFAWTGTLLGLASLYLMQQIVRRRAGTAVSWLFAVVVVALSGFGVYLGRFPRYNSWDLFTSPLELLGSVWEQVSHPLTNWHAFAFSGLFSLVFISVYLVFVAMTRWPLDVPQAEY
jgi:uncharacterized membrane protein